MKRKNENRFEGVMVIATVIMFTSLILGGLTDRTDHPVMFYTWIGLLILSFVTLGRVAYLSEEKKR